MMKMSRRVMSCCVALLLVLLSSVSAVRKVKSINGLKKINFGQSVPKHSLILLHWFANVVDIDNNNVIWLNFDPNSGDYGSHHYGNFEELLDPLPRGYRYYTVGNLNQDNSRQLPSYVVNPQREYEGRNRDRIIFRVQEQNTGWGALQRIDQVFITQHYGISENQGTQYDPDHTYQITTNLLRQIREFSVTEGQRPLQHLINHFGSNADDFYIRDTWGNLACLGLLLFIVIKEKYSSNQHNNRPNMNNRPENNIQMEIINRPENNYRWENNNRRENDNQAIINIGAEINNRAENSCCGCRRLVISFFILILVLLVIILSSYFATK